MEINVGTGDTWANNRIGDGLGQDYYGYDEVVATAGSSGTNSSTFFEAPAGFAWTVALNDAGPAPVLTQTAYRWRNDDGSETTATWLAAENTPL
jgi:hypothetical protein